MNSFNNSNFCPRQNPQPNNFNKFTIEHYGIRTPEKLCRDNGGALAKAEGGASICIKQDFKGTSLQGSSWDYLPKDGEIKFSWEDHKNYVCTETLVGKCLPDKIHVWSYDKGKDRAYFLKNNKPVVAQCTTQPRPSGDTPIGTCRLLSLHEST
uniref:Uncharacterized protein n=1 Tax=viral metagenome TaxID=1070528 RepID=A0A6C0D0H4_9ZZZZ